jgi:hypothetical protein
MSRQARKDNAEAQLRALEEQFSTDLVAALRDCAAGKWGMFGQNDHLVSVSPMLASIYTATAEKLTGQGREITKMRHELGYVEPFSPFERYLHYRELRSANSPGEPRLAVQFLAELDK